MASGGSRRRQSDPAFAAFFVLLAAVVATTSFAETQEEKAKPEASEASPARQSIAFTGPELLKLDWGAPAMAVGDVNGDGLLDLVVANPAKARIDCFLQRSAQEMAEAAAESQRPDAHAVGAQDTSVESDDVNRLPDALRFRSRPLAVEKRVFSLVVADLTGDGRDDLAYYGEPRELVVVAQTEEGAWGARQTFDITDGCRNPGGLAAADLNGDGRPDLILLAPKALYLMLASEKGVLGRAEKLPASADGSSFLLVGDYDGDGRVDLAYPVPHKEHPLCFRLATSDGGLGPEQFAELPGFRAAVTVHRAGEPRTTLALILATSGRIQLLELSQQTAEEERPGAGLLLHPLEEDATPRQFACADVNGDGRADVVATCPSTAQIAVLFQREDGGLEQPKLYPSLAGVAALRVGDLEGDGRVELVVLSKEEQAIGYSRWETTGEGHGRVGFPRTIAFAGRPLAVATGDLDGDGRDELLYARVEEKKYYVASRAVGESNELSEEKAVELEGLETDVSGLLATDLNRDGHLDALAFVSFGPARLLLGDGQGQLRDTSGDPAVERSLLHRLKPASIALGDIDGDGAAEVLVAEKNYARALSVGADGSPQVVDQANGTSPRSEIASAAVADLDGDGSGEVILLDNWAKELTVLRRLEDGTLGDPRSLSLAGLPFDRVLAAELTGDAREDLLVLGRDRIGVVPGKGASWTFQLRGDYESDAEQAFLGDLVAGDLFGDGSDELLVLDTRNHNLELLRQQEEPGLNRLYRFTVFEKKVFRGREQESREPRQALLADLTGDGRTDIALLVHDRIVLYPQVAPEEAPGVPASDQDSVRKQKDIGSMGPQTQQGGARE